MEYNEDEYLMLSGIQHFKRGYTPKVKKNKMCTSCSLKEICMPELEKTMTVSSYISKALREE